MNKILSILLLSFINLYLKAQFYPVFSQYLTNGLIINPAYAGSANVLTFNMLYRKQMVGFKGSPEYFVISSHTPLKKLHIGIGALFFNEKIGPINNSHLYFNYAYRLATARGILSLGIKAGIIYNAYSWDKIYLNNQNDPAFTNQKQTYILPNVGAGLLYYTGNFFTGLSIPYFITYSNKDKFNISLENNFKNYNFLFLSGYTFKIIENFKWKPSVLFRYYGQSQSQLDLNSNFILLKNRIVVSAAYRTNEAIVGAFDIQLNQQLRLAYTYEYTNRIAKFFNYTSHEISLRYEFQYRIKTFNPRYF